MAFFFAMVLFSFGLDLAAFVPGFFFIGIRYPPLRLLLLDERKTYLASLLINCMHYRNTLCGNQELGYIFINKF